MELPLMSIPQEVCSPLRQCFPPRPTRCLSCGATSVKECPYKKKKEEGGGTR
jgi:hypothetical protein